MTVCMLLRISETLGSLKILTMTKNTISVIRERLSLIKSKNLSQLSILDLELNNIGQERLTKFPDGAANDLTVST